MCILFAARFTARKQLPSSCLPINHHRRDSNDVNHNTLPLRLTSNASSALNTWRMQNLISKLLNVDVAQLDHLVVLPQSSDLVMKLQWCA